VWSDAGWPAARDRGRALFTVAAVPLVVTLHPRAAAASLSVTLRVGFAQLGF